MNTFTITVSEKAMHELIQKDPILGSFIEKTGPLSREGIKDPYLACLDCIISQQVSTKAAQSISDRFFNQFENGDPQKILDASLDEIRACGMSNSKASYLKNIAQAKIDKSVDFENLHHLSSQEITDLLLPIKGVGRWTVEMLLIFTLEKEDILSYGDLAILRGMMRIYHKKEITPAFFNKIKKRLSPHLSAASFYFWKASAEKENIPYTNG